MKPSLVLKMGQQLTMTPQLQQAIRLLQLSTLDLQQEIQEALESNPMLERQEDGDDYDNSDPMADGDDSAAQGASSNSQDSFQESTTPSVDSLDEDQWAERIPNELPVDTAWEDIYQTSASSLPSSDDDEWDFTARTSAGESLQSHLLWQVNLAPMSDTDRLIALSIIDGINDDGYLEESLDDILASLDPELGVEMDEVEVVLRRVQQLEPAGVGARNLRECLLLQLRQLPAKTYLLTEALKLVSDHLDLLGSRDYSQLMRRMKLKEDELRETIELIQSLHPRPGSQIESGEAEYVVPDVIVRKHNDRWLVELNQEAVPRLRVNSQYAGLVRRADSSADNTFIRNQLQEARWFIKSLQSRNETLMKVATQIVEHQRGFLEYGEEAMKPLVLHDIAEAVGMHESTISRVTTQKFMHTPRGIFELKYFFSSHVSTAEGGECSSTAIRAIIKKLVAAESPKKPLSDSKIAGLLEAQGIQVARRTVAKYRESLGIAPSSERKRLV
ncbi:RNA polymerase factor sigma-54 [Pseudomonas sp. ATCC 13867]|uniref:RNA polymerase factor sigma-54 n=1 Tax=Pseudomonas sp. ATCC 13867 TaxID=1294143 RepID=UPI0002C4E1A2|nr:RNA polymerase factor sigma-54 [Pseudomonas sp. ATCC 13867]AGI22956.1 RNA polymerase factor sigma-54 [Pseudomonas sp. ATCC 13867]RFQ25486.1 RNA polymerase factor sigma-54 [Pseudomonas sp. ATCC 13867]